MNELIVAHFADFALFARVVEAGGFTAASRATGVPQTTISRRIAHLESTLQLRLLERSTRRVVTTDTGLKIYQYCRRALDEIEGARSYAGSLLEEPTGLVRITAPIVFGQRVLAGLVAEFLSQYPKVHLQVELTGRQLDLIEEGFDIAIHVGRPEISSLVKVPLVKACAAYYAAPHLARSITSPEQLFAAPWLAPGSLAGQAKWRLVDSITLREQHSHKKEVRLKSSDMETLVACAKNGLGVAILPEFAAPAELARVLPQYVASEVEVNALVVSRRSMMPAVRAFLDFLKAHVPNSDMAQIG